MNKKTAHMPISATAQHYLKIYRAIAALYSQAAQSVQSEAVNIVALTAYRGRGIAF